MKHLGEFYGSNFRPVTLDAFVATRIKKSDLGDIASLYETKWFGYRYLSPGQSLFLFADRYRKSIAKVRREDSLRGIGMTAANALSTISDNHLTGFWRAMCFADAFGIPYDFFCETQVNSAMRRGLKHPPTPMKMYSDEAIWHVKTEWEKTRCELFTRTEDPHYTLSEHEDDWQVQYQEYLLDIIEGRTGKAHALASVIYRKPQVRPSRAAARFGIEAVKDARQISRRSS